MKMPHHYLVRIPIRETWQVDGLKYNHRMKGNPKTAPVKAVAGVYMRALWLIDLIRHFVFNPGGSSSLHKVTWCTL